MLLVENTWDESNLQSKQIYLTILVTAEAKQGGADTLANVPRWYHNMAESRKRNQMNTKGQGPNGLFRVTHTPKLIEWGQLCPISTRKLWSAHGAGIPRSN